MTATCIQLPDLHARLAGATTPEAVFGSLPAPQGVQLRKSFLEMVRAVHPDRNPADKHLAERAFALLVHWRDRAQERIDRGTYGTTTREPRLVRTPRAIYRVSEPAIRADYADIFAAESGAGPALCFKITRDPCDNPLAFQEARALQALQNSRGTGYFPTLIESFVAQDAAVRRRTTIYDARRAPHTLADVRRACPAGIDPRDAAWMFNRLLEALFHAHNASLIHGAITPENVHIDIENHGLILAEWGYSVAPGEPLSAISAPFESWYPPEVFARKAATPALDISMAARCLDYLLAGNAGPFGPLLRACLLPAPARRPNDAGALREDVGSLLRARFGKPVFRAFSMPR
jgi:hypothetical protein